ncbi:hypothetical protein BH09BAC2_BH09BAC2_17380 [soil metagenome]
MIKFNEVKVGNYLLAENDGEVWTGEVTNLNGDEKQICVYNGVQDFWFSPEELNPLPLNEEQLMKLNFTKEVQEDGPVKYKKGAFRMMIPSEGNFSHFEIWYRDEKRQILNPIAVHQLQNHYHDMTKVHLTDEVFQ